MMSLTNILSMTCIATLGGVFAYGKMLPQNNEEKVPEIRAFMYGQRDWKPQHSSIPQAAVSMFGPQLSPDDPDLVHAQEQYHNILADALMENQLAGGDGEASDVIVINSGGVHPGEHQRKNVWNPTDPRSAAIFNNSRRGRDLRSLGRSASRFNGPEYRRWLSDRRAVSPTGNTSVFQRSRFYSRTGAKYTYSGVRVRRIDRLQRSR
ncbi:MAG: hypothetical protein ACYTGC_03180 [Planctomycetota bacterium]|jgi:hypothetical protein